MSVPHKVYSFEISFYKSKDDILKKHALDGSDLDYFEKVILDACKKDSNYDGFADNGGIDIAAILLFEIKRRDLDL